MSPLARTYLIAGLTATPSLVGLLVSDVDNAVADHRPAPDRFTLRELVAHLADWDTVWLERVRRMITEDEPILPSLDPDDRARDNRYSDFPVAHWVERFVENRGALVDFLNGLSTEEWERTGFRDGVGGCTVGEIAVMALGHDNGHQRQLAEMSGR
ncbi:MAG: DinB family protein [Armatimonadaceae bacterium]